MAAKLMKLVRGEVPFVVILDKLGVNKLLNLFGIEVVRKGCMYYKYYWERAYKKIDLKKIPVFSEIAAHVIADKTTYMDYDRLYTLWQFVNCIDSDEQAIVEVGTYWGGSAWFIAESLCRVDRKNTFFVFDTFEGHTVVDESVDGEHRVKEGFSDVSYEKVKSYLSVFSNLVLTKGDFLKTSNLLDDVKSFALVHIDVDVYPVTKYCLEFFKDRMITGGVIIVDDYGFTTCKGAKKAVDEFIGLRKDFFMFHLMTGQAVLAKLGSDVD
ncbi:MAG: class I SAM-dependent methyltransferase [Candidatus Altiarchaeota archaeon]|nr:class I SAM-dependent methyltransferase [Candidatus Altiarchaeota archaeon]